MNISYNWLKQYINHRLEPSELANVLTGIGLEVETIESVGGQGNLDGFVIGEIKTCQEHPEADKLFITTVDIGENTPLNIVCGAPNAAAGQHVVVATIGSTVHRGDQSLRIKKAKIRNVVSEGMICAEDEIGMGDDHDGILVLPESAPVGVSASSYLNPEPDIRLTIGLTPNRIDGASHIGVARDLAASFHDDNNVKLLKPDLSDFREGDGSYNVQVIIENELACRRYAGVCISGVKITESPGWLQRRLRSVGLNPINNVVDITNFVLFEMGQPLHAFDADTLKRRQIIVKNMADGTKFTTLDGIEHVLSDEDLMICDGEGPVAIAGVFGGINSGVTGSTTNLFLESAYFDPISIRRTSKRHGINTDASFRFERGIDPDMTIDALKRCALLITDIAGGMASSSIVDVYPRPVNPKKVKLNYNNTNELIGKRIDPETIKSILTSLEIEITDEDEQGLVLLIPPYRVDVDREADVIEEVLRIYGYNNIEMSDTLNASLSFSSKPDQESYVDAISDYLCSNGFYEIMCNSLTKSAYYEGLNSFRSENLVRLLNPLSNDLNVMRQTLIFGGMETINHNTNRQRPDLKLFEFGKCYRIKPTKSGKEPLDKFDEEWLLSMFLTGNVSDSDQSSTTEFNNFFLLKAYLEGVLALTGIDTGTIQLEDIQDKQDMYATGIRYSINDMYLADLAVIKSDILNMFDIRNEIYYAEVNWYNLIELTKNHQISHKDLPKFPEVRRDLSLLLDRNVTYYQIKNLAFRTEKLLLKRMQLFDVFEGEKIEPGKKSYAVSFILQDTERTLTDKKIDQIMKRLMETYVKELDAVIR